MYTLLFMLYVVIVWRVISAMNSFRSICSFNNEDNKGMINCTQAAQIFLYIVLLFVPIIIVGYLTYNVYRKRFMKKKSNKRKKTIKEKNNKRKKRR